MNVGVVRTSLVYYAHWRTMKHERLYIELSIQSRRNRQEDANSQLLQCPFSPVNPPQHHISHLSIALWIQIAGQWGGTHTHRDSVWLRTNRAITLKRVKSLQRRASPYFNMICIHSWHCFHTPLPSAVEGPRVSEHLGFYAAVGLAMPPVALRPRSMAAVA